MRAFESVAPGFHRDRARLLAALSKDIYRSEASFREAWEPFVDELHFHRAGNTVAAVLQTRSGIVVAFRGSDDSEDWDANFETRLTSAPYLVGKVHAGFHAEWERARFLVEASLVAMGSDLVWLTGHSLGGALATIAASYLDTRHFGHPVGGVYTFGAPRCGDARFAESLPQLWRFAAPGDLVTAMPPLLAGYRHGGHLQYLDSDGHIRTSPSWRDRIRALWRRGSEAGHSIDNYVELLEMRDG